MNDYFSGTVSQLLCRAKHLTERVPNPLSPALAPLLEACQKRINHITEDLQWLLDEPTLQLPANQPARFRACAAALASLTWWRRRGSLRSSVPTTMICT